MRVTLCEFRAEVAEKARLILDEFLEIDVVPAKRKDTRVRDNEISKAARRKISGSAALEFLCQLMLVKMIA